MVPQQHRGRGSESHKSSLTRFRLHPGTARHGTSAWSLKAHPFQSHPQKVCHPPRQRVTRRTDTGQHLGFQQKRVRAEGACPSS